MKDSIFTKIIKGEIPSYIVYEDDRVIAFLDIHPKTPGHTLVVTKNQVDQFQDLPDEDYSAMMSVVKKVAQRQKEILYPARIGVEIIGVDVPHAHVHVFPFDNMDEYHRKVYTEAEPDHTALAEMAKRLRF